MKTTYLFALAFFVSFTPTRGLADWKGRLEVTGVEGQVGGGSGPMPGKIFAKGTKIRLEMQAMGRDAVLLADVKSNQASMLMPEQKLAMQMPASMTEKQKMVSCPTNDVDGCLKVKGYKKIGSETIDGHPCVIYEGTEFYGKHKTRQRIWRPTDLKEVFMVKSLSKSDGGHEIIAMVKDIRVGQLEDALFRIPTGFQKMQMPDFGAVQR